MGYRSLKAAKDENALCDALDPFPMHKCCRILAPYPGNLILILSDVGALDKKSGKRLLAYISKLELVVPL